MPPALPAAFDAAVLARGLAAGTPAAATEGVRLLEAGRPVESALSAGNEQAYEIRLERGEFIRVAIEQRGIDVISTLYDPVGRPLVALDGPTGSMGVETLFFVASRGGTHRLVVRPFSKHSAAGRYEIRVVERRNADASDRLREDPARRGRSGARSGVLPRWSGDARREPLERFRPAFGRPHGGLLSPPLSGRRES
jgi:hypothetical protein